MRQTFSNRAMALNSAVSEVTGKWARELYALTGLTRGHQFADLQGPDSVKRCRLTAAGCLQRLASHHHRVVDEP